MARFSVHHLTAWGQQQLAATQNGGGTRFTSIAYGDGYHSDPATATELASERVRLDVGNNHSREDALFTAWGFLSGAILDDELYLREAGLYTADPSDPDNREADKLYALITVNTADDRDFFVRIAPSGSDMLTDVRVAVSTVISDQAEVTVETWLTFEGVRSVNSIGPDATGNVQISYQNVGAAPTFHQHSQYATNASLHRVAKSGQYDDLEGLPDLAVLAQQEDVDALSGTVTSLDGRVTATESGVQRADNHAALRNNPHAVRPNQIAMAVDDNTSLWSYLGGALTGLTTTVRTSIIAAINALQADKAERNHTHALANITNFNTWPATAVFIPHGGAVPASRPPIITCFVRMWTNLSITGQTHQPCTLTIANATSFRGYYIPSQVATVLGDGSHYILQTNAMLIPNTAGANFSIGAGVFNTRVSGAAVINTTTNIGITMYRMS